MNLDAVETRYLVELAKTFAHILLVLVLAAIALALSRRLIRLFGAFLSRKHDGPEDLKRVQTLTRVFRYVANVVILVVGGLLILDAVGIAIAPILGAAGVVGIAVGFGAQSLIKDYFNGFFLVLENQVREGDVAELGGKAGLVEEMTLRYVRLRDYNGNVHYVPNGSITTVTNMTRTFAFSVIDVSVAYREDLDQVYDLIRRTAAAMREDPEWGPRILEELELAGVERWADSGIVVRCRFKVLPIEQWNVRREFYKRLKKVFDDNGIEIPYPHLTLYPGRDKRGEAPPLHILPVGEGGEAFFPKTNVAEKGDHGTRRRSHS